MFMSAFLCTVKQLLAGSVSVSVLVMVVVSIKSTGLG